MNKDDPELILKVLRDQMDVMAGAQVAMAVGLNLLLTGIREHPDLGRVLHAELEGAHARMLSGTSTDAKIEGFDIVAKSMKAAIKPD
jgi:hypothetical protein